MGNATSSTATSAKTRGGGGNSSSSTNNNNNASKASSAAGVFSSKRTQVSQVERKATVEAIRETAVTNVHAMLRALPSNEVPQSSKAGEPILTVHQGGVARGAGDSGSGSGTAPRPDSFHAFLTRCAECAGRGGAVLIKDELVHLALLVSTFQGGTFQTSDYATLSRRGVEELYAALRLAMYHPDTLRKLNEARRDGDAPQDSTSAATNALQLTLR